LIVSEPPLVLFGFFVLYSLSDYVMAALRYLRPGPSPTQTP
jgi:CDP-diacylglycerol--serine O-phosphatidyltransferase